MALIPYFASLDYGSGYDTLAQRVRGDSVVQTARKTVEGTGGSIVDFRLAQVETHKQLLEALDISASVSLGNAITGGGSAQASFSNQHSLDEYSIYLLVTVNVVKSHERMRDVHLNDAAYHLMDKQGADEFRKRYGDAFVVGMTTGGRYFGLIQIHCQHQEDKQNISASIRASGGLGQWSASGDFNAAMSLTGGEVIGDVLTQKLQLRFLRLRYRVLPRTFLFLPLFKERRRGDYMLWSAGKNRYVTGRGSI